MSGQLGPFRIDSSVRCCGPDATLLIGGSPIRLLRLSGAGAELFEQLGTGETVRATRGVRALVARLVAGGLVHPVPAVVQTEVAHQVTVVVPVRDHSNSLARLLESLVRSQPSPAQVIVVDDGSVDSDRVDATISRAASQLEVELVRLESSGGPAAARNAGAERVATPVVAFVDADCVVATDWLGPLLAQLDDPAVALVAPRVTAASTHRAGPPERYDRERSPLDLGREPARIEPGTRVSYVPSAALVLRTEDLARLGGFDPKLRVGEDVDLVWRLVGSGRAARYDPRSVVRHEVRTSLRSWAAQRFAYGSSAAVLDERHPGRVAPVVCSRWSALLWALVAIGRYESAVAVAFATTARLRSELRDVPIDEVVRLGLGGHAAAGLQFARATVRVWWPAALVASMCSRRARRVAVMCWVASTADALRRRTDADLAERVEFVAMYTADELSYGAGVWVGSLRRRSWRALLPALK